MYKEVNSLDLVRRALEVTQRRMTFAFKYNPCANIFDEKGVYLEELRRTIFCMAIVLKHDIRTKHVKGGSVYFFARETSPFKRLSRMFPINLDVLFTCTLYNVKKRISGTFVKGSSELRINNLRSCATVAKESP